MSNSELERLAAGYAGWDFRKRHRVRMEPMLEYSSAEWTLDEFLAALQKIKSEMPPDATDAKVEFGCGGYNESANFSVSYETWEADSEVADRVNRALAYAEEKQSAELRHYECLKAKYG